ncbi:MAG: hypothetical protein IJQ24_03130, partial [Synergistaceae bacterium]|nr:hypothetical protein [Synergistaceae bacterium]
NRSVPINIEGIIAMQRSVRLSNCVAFFIFIAIKQSIKVSETGFCASRKSEPIFCMGGQA